MKKDKWVISDLKTEKYLKKFGTTKKDTFYLEKRCRYIYKITCTMSGKSYIGRSNDPSTRVYNHYLSLSNGTHPVEEFQNDFDRYGEDAFVLSIIGEDNFGSNSEKKLQELLKTYDSEFGYNYKDSYWVSKKG